MKTTGKSIFLSCVLTLASSSAFAGVDDRLNATESIHLGSSLCKEVASYRNPYSVAQCIEGQKLNVLAVVDGAQMTFGNFVIGVCNQIDSESPKGGCLEEGLKLSNDNEAFKALKDCPPSPKMEVRKAIAKRNTCIQGILTNATVN